MNPWPTIPKDAVEHFRSAFAQANRVATERLANVPNIREASLDDALVDALIPFSPPKRLQTKRLYPKNNDVLDDDPEGFRYGMNAFLNRDMRSPLAVLIRKFEFDETCVYGALTAGNEQIETITRLNSQAGESVFYMFYNPSSVPVTVNYPVRSKRKATAAKLGCRVFLSQEVHAVLDALAKDRSPTLKAVVAGGKSSNWRLESWIADLVLACKLGRRFDEGMQDKVSMLLERRSGPIGAAIAISIALPND